MVARMILRKGRMITSTVGGVRDMGARTVLGREGYMVARMVPGIPRDEDGLRKRMVWRKDNVRVSKG